LSIVTLNNVEKSFAGQRLFTTVVVLGDAHDHAVLVGRNGSGKTTLLRLISGDEPATQALSHAPAGGASGFTNRRRSLSGTALYGTTCWRRSARPSSSRRRCAPLRRGCPGSPSTARSFATDEDLSAAPATLEAAGGYAYRDRLGGVVGGPRPAGAMLERGLLSPPRRAHPRDAGPGAPGRRPTCCCSTNPRTTSTSTPSNGSRLPRRLRARLRPRHPRPPPARKVVAASLP